MKLSITLRPLRDEDAPYLLSIHVEAIRAIDDTHYSSVERESWAFGLTPVGYLDAMAKGETFLVAVNDNDIPVGFCSWSAAQLVGLYVTPQYQGQSIGSALLEATEHALAAGGVGVSIVHASVSAIPFYQRHGYLLTRYTDTKSRGGLPMRSAYLEKQLGPTE